MFKTKISEEKLFLIFKKGVNLATKTTRILSYVHFKIFEIFLGYFSVFNG